MYVDAVFRICKKSQLNNTPEYDKNYHSRDRLPHYRNPVAWGLINVYSRGEDDGNRYIDYGEADRYTFEKMLRDVDDNKLATSLLYLEFANNRLDILFAQGITTTCT